MKLKKIAIILTLCISTVLSTCYNAFAAANIFSVPSLKYEMTIPRNYYAMPRTSPIDDGALAAIVGAPGANFNVLDKQEIVMISSADYSAQGEYLLVIARSDFTKRVENFYNKSEDYLTKEWTAALMDKKYMKFDFLDLPEARFVHTHSAYENDMFENYITVKNGTYYMISARFSGNYNESFHDDLLKSLVNSIHFTSHDTIVRINGEGLDFEQNPVMFENRTLVPLRTIFETLGATVDWDDATKTVTSKKGDVEVKLQINSNKLYKNGNPVELDAPAILFRGYTMVPVRAVAEAFGCGVDWNGNARIVEITTK